MKQAEILPAVLAGQKLVVGQFRDFELKTFPSKQPNEQPTVIGTTFVLVGREVVSVQEFGDKGKGPEAFKRPAYKVGDSVVVRFRDWQTTKWGTRLSGTTEALQP